MCSKSSERNTLLPRCHGDDGEVSQLGQHGGGQGGELGRLTHIVPIYTIRKQLQQLVVRCLLCVGLELWYQDEVVT